MDALRSPVRKEAASCDRYEKAWRAGHGPRIEDYLAEVAEADRPTLLGSMLALDLGLRLQRGDRVDPSEYAERFAAYRDVIAAVFDSAPTCTHEGESGRASTERASGVLFGMLALRDNLVSREALREAYTEWAGDGSSTLGWVLEVRGELGNEDRDRLETRVQEQLDFHGGDPIAALAALDSEGTTRADLERLGAPVVTPGATVSAADADATMTTLSYTVKAGPPTSLESGFQIVRPHAKGGLGEVFVARDLVLKREVALKGIRPDRADDPENQSQFLWEAEVTGRLEHPGIVPVYGLGRHDDDRPYYVMRFIRGETLQDAIDRFHGAGRGDQALTLHALVRRFIEVCYAIAYAHSRGMIHRDLKPNNIMLGPFGETLVVDWGLARPFERPADTDRGEEETLRPGTEPGPSGTVFGSGGGTPGYMSPEQESNLLDELGPASDEYSLGATLYVLLTGERPIKGRDRLVIHAKTIAGDFPRPREVKASTPAALDAVCMKAMALRPADRYGSARRLAEDLERWLDDEPVSVYAEPFTVRFARWSRRHKSALASAATLLISATLGMAAFSVMLRRENARIEAARKDAEANLLIARKAIGQMHTDFSGPDLAYLPASEPLRIRNAERVLALYRQLLKSHPDDPDVRLEAAEAFHQAGNVGRTAGQFDEPRENYRVATELLEGLIRGRRGKPRHLHLLAETLLDTGDFMILSGHPRDAEAPLRSAQKLSEAFARDDPLQTDYVRTRAKIEIDLAAVHRQVGRGVTAIEEYERALAFLSPLVETAKPSTIDRLLYCMALTGLGTAQRKTNDPLGSALTLTLSIREGESLRKDFDNRDTQFQLASAYLAEGELLAEVEGSRPRAMNSYDKAYQILIPLYKAYPYVPFYWRQLAVLLNDRGEWFAESAQPGPAVHECQTARALTRKAVTRPSATGDDHLALGRALATLGRVSRSRDLLTLAVASLELARKANPENPDYERALTRCRDDLARLPVTPP